MEEREKYIDLVKGGAILCIVLLHYVDGIFPIGFNIFIGWFMIATFYVTSGWLSAMHPSQRTFKEYIRKRWRQLGIPYLWWTGIIIGFDLILYAFGYYDLKFIGKEVYKAITLRGIGTLWFLPALFGGELIFRWLQNKKHWIILSSVLFTIIYKWGYDYIFSSHKESIYRVIDAPFRTISNILGAWVVIAASYYFYLTFRIFINKGKAWQLFLVGFVLCVVAYGTGNYTPPFLGLISQYLTPILAPIGFLLIFKTLHRKHLWILDYLDYWGKNSLNLMVTHYSITLVLCHIIVEDVLKKPFYGWVSLICFFISMILQYMAVKPIDRYAKITLGK